MGKIFNRNNLKYQVMPKKGADLTSIIQQQFKNKTGIIYCLSKKDCDDLAKDLRKAAIMEVKKLENLLAQVKDVPSQEQDIEQ